MINRELYNGYLTQDDMSKWQCPTCNSGLLQLNKDKFINEYNSFTKINEHHEEFNFPYDITYTFTTLLTCTNLNCKDVVTCSGTGYVENEQYSYEDSRYVEYFKPFFFYPSLNVFQIPEKTPKNVQESIKNSFSIVFTNNLVASNQIRIALECLLTHLKVNRYRITKARKKKRLLLHERIELLPVKYQKIKDICLAIKWLGNAGSHCGDEMTFDDVFNGYDMLSFVLEELYDNKHTHVTKLAKRINAKKGVK